MLFSFLYNINLIISFPFDSSFSIGFHVQNKINALTRGNIYVYVSIYGNAIKNHSITMKLAYKNQLNGYDGASFSNKSHVLYTFHTQTHS